ncbi:MAG: hypothetical protein IEMM0002_0197 [bacterium]|nr:MAG: hypothetical protein IEMM0002_0197 [bacterium]
MKYVRFFVVIAAACLLFSGKAYAYTCTITVNNMGFGSYDIYTYEAAKKYVEFTSIIYTYCSSSMARNGTISLSWGNDPSGGARRMQIGSTGEFLKYNLYKDSGYSSVWGDTGTERQINVALNSGSGSGRGKYFTIWGAVDMYQDALAAGSYADTIVVTLEYYL